MCGIAGAIVPGLSESATRQLINRMTDPIIHRGPDDAGSICGPGKTIGMPRLSIIDLAGGHQPIANEDGSLHVVCNGEIYNYRDLRADLENRGHRFATGSDSEVVLHLYEEHGDAFLERMRGMFGLALWDQRRDRIIIARDRIGKKPMFYATLGENFYFGSEMKSLLAAEPKLNEPDYRRIGQFFQFGYIRQPETIYRRIHRLPAGHMAIFEKGKLSIKPYWSLSFAADETMSESQWLEELDATLAESVRIRLESEVPLGVFLSGGLDSSAVVAYAHAAGLRPLKTFTIGFDRAEWDESEDAARVAKHFDTEHHLLRISEADLCQNFERTLEQIVFHCDEPFGDASAIPTHHVSRLAREHVKVILSGDGGDELFAGYSSYQGALFGQTYRRLVPYPIGRYFLPSMLRMAANVLPGRQYYQALRFSKVLRNSALPLTQGYREKISIWHADELRELLTPDIAAQITYLGEQYLPDPWWERLNGKEDLVARLSEIDIHTYMLDDILVKVDRMSMANSLEVRSPLLDHKMVELAARLPTRFKIRNGRGKYLLREILKPKLPAKTTRKGKQGFSVPLRDWFRGSLKGLVHEYLGGSGYLPEEIFSQRMIQRILQEHDRGVADHAQQDLVALGLRRLASTISSRVSVDGECHGDAGGIVVRVLMICPELPRPGQPGTMAPGLRQIQSIQALGIDTEIVDMHGIPKLKYLQLLPRIRRYAKQVDVIHAHFGYCGWLAKVATLFDGVEKPTVMSYMGDDLLGTPCNTNGDLTRFSKMAVRCNKTVAKSFNRVIVKSREMANVLKPVPCEVIPNGVDVDEFQPMDRIAACDALKVPSDGFNVLFPGNPKNPRKGHDLATQAIAVAEKEIGKPIRLLILSGVTPEQVPYYMNACHAMLMTSFIEGSPNVVKEAMAANLPVIGVPVGDVHQLLDGVKNSIRCSRDPNELGTSLAKVLLNGERSSGRSAILSRGLDLKSVARQIVSIYEQALRQPVTCQAS